MAYQQAVLEGDPGTREILAKGIDTVEKMLTTPFWAGEMKEIKKAFSCNYYI